MKLNKKLKPYIYINVYIGCWFNDELKPQLSLIVC